MKRNWDLIRLILLRLEALNAGDDFDAHFNGYTDEDVQYHLYLLTRAGLIDSVDYSRGGDLHFVPQMITWEGQEFIDGARNKTVWDAVKNDLKKRGADASFEILKVLLTKAAMRMMGL